MPPALALPDSVRLLCACVPGLWEKKKKDPLRSWQRLRWPRSLLPGNARPWMVTFHTHVAVTQAQASLLGAAQRRPGGRAGMLSSSQRSFVGAAGGGRCRGPHPVTQPHCWAMTHAQAPSGRTPPAAGAARSSFHKCPLQSLPWQLSRPVTRTRFRESPRRSDGLVLLGAAPEGAYPSPQSPFLLVAKGWPPGAR